MSAAADIASLTREEQVDIYLKAVLQDLGGFIDMRTISPDGSVIRRALSGVPAAKKLLANGHTDGRNVYVGQATRISNSTAKDAGAKDQLYSGRVLWVDVDFEKKGDAEKLAAALKTFPFKPSMRVDSGNGEHVYWFIEPFDLSTKTKRTQFECNLKGICDALGGDRAATDSSRILRVPGTINYPNAKKRAAGRVEVPAVLLEHHQ